MNRTFLALLFVVPFAVHAVPLDVDARAVAKLSLPPELRMIDGTGNNVGHPAWGATNTPLRRLALPAYADGVEAPAGEGRANARMITDAVVSQFGAINNASRATDLLWQWGQFIDHDMDLTPAAGPAEPFDIPVPRFDPFFDPLGFGTQSIGLNRSLYTMVSGVRQQVNVLTAFLDGSNVYGADASRALGLRALDGTGRLKTTPTAKGELLPYNDAGFENGGDGPTFFLAGDIRANEQAGLTAMHTLFVREHNHWAAAYAASHPGASDEEIYQFARLIVSGEIQAITFNEFLPVLLGRGAIPRYRGYDPQLDPSIANEFSTAAFRIGHSLLSPTLRRLDTKLRTIPTGNLSLADAFFNPALIEDEGIDSLLRGLAAQKCQELDGMVTDSVRNFLFGQPGAGGFDLAALNIQRGRDHGLPTYKDACLAMGLPAAVSMGALNPDPMTASRLAGAYGNVDDIDLWVGGLCEPHVRRSMVGRLFHSILVDQFIRLRDGDRFWYRTHLPRALIRLVDRQTLVRIIRRNTEIGREIRHPAFTQQSGERPKD